MFFKSTRRKQEFHNWILFFFLVVMMISCWLEPLSVQGLFLFCIQKYIIISSILLYVVSKWRWGYLIFVFVFLKKKLNNWIRKLLAEYIYFLLSWGKLAVNDKELFFSLSFPLKVIQYPKYAAYFFLLCEYNNKIKH